MAIAYDAGSQPAQSTNDPLSWTHTPVGTPRGVFVVVWSENDATDTVTGVTYGGVAMTEVTGSPLANNAGGSNDDGHMSVFFLGSSIPSGPQTVSVDMTGTSVEHGARCVTVTADGDTQIEDSDGNANSSGDATVTLTTAVVTFLLAAGWSGANAAGTMIVTGFTSENNQGLATNTSEVAYKTGVAAGSPAGTVDEGPSSCLLIMAAIKELASQNAPRSMYYHLEGVR